MHKICQNCDFYDDYEFRDDLNDKPKVGYCCRYPKKVVKFASEWCGEFVSKTNEEEELYG